MIADVRFVNAGGRASLLVDGQVFDLEQASGGAIPRWPTETLVAHWDEALALAERGAPSGGVPLEGVHLGPPVPMPRAVYAIGLNYRGHAQEVGADVGPIPSVFTKFSSSISGPYDDVVLPRGEGTTDWEAELAFVVGAGGRNVRSRDALESLRGFMVAQDISERFVQMAGGRQFSLGKSFDTFCPCGPALVTLDELERPDDLRITCRVNGDLKQDARTTDMIIDVANLVEVLSSVMTLGTGDICLTGTPAGVGFMRRPPVYLRPGDVIETEIEGVGAMRNRCVAEPPPGPGG
ncbi:MAG TPA: fumarylacetoacetate hydrolase family protein [Acidimicrobiales bacterium]|nr:fumarylacetoacetate hydrolase family protein [Acidimicrobiales bacterium]